MTFDADHSVSDHWIALAAVVINGLDKQGAAKP